MAMSRFAPTMSVRVEGRGVRNRCFGPNLCHLADVVGPRPPYLRVSLARRNAEQERRRGSVRHKVAVSAIHLGLTAAEAYEVLRDFERHAQLSDVVRSVR